MICVPTQQLCLILHGLYPGDHLFVILLVHIGAINLHNPEDTDVILTTSDNVSVFPVMVAKYVTSMEG